MSDLRNEFKSAVDPGAIDIAGLNLSYPIYENIVSDRLRDLLGAAFPRLRPKTKGVLKDVNFSIRPGEVVGLLGVNGAGKTTLLKVIAGLLQPDSGTVRVGGRVTALMAMGVGFRGNLTGRENLYLVGLLLGSTRAEIKRLLPKIHEFSGLGDAMDQPFFTYSSGMKARLSFSLATANPGDLVILDETLATGDRRFVSQCYERIQEISRSGRTVLFVSHNLGEVARLTERVLTIERGQIVFDGATSDGIDRYESGLMRVVSEHDENLLKLHNDVSVSVDVLDSRGNRCEEAFLGDAINIECRIFSRITLGPQFVFLKLSHMSSDDLVAYLIPGRWKALTDPEAHFENVAIGPGQTRLTWLVSPWNLGEGTFSLDAYIGPAVHDWQVDLSTGRHWRRAAVIVSRCPNAKLKGAQCILEFPCEPSIECDPNAAESQDFQ